MLKITNGKEVLIVSGGAYKAQYKPFGWEIVDESKPNIDAEYVYVETDEEPPIVVVEKPLSEMTAKELKAKARELGVDISSATNKSEARKMLADVIR